MRECVLGIDTSNYTTSAALVDVKSGELVRSVKKLLPVKAGELGLRQSDAVFHHTVQLPEILTELFDKACDIKAVGVSTKPTDEEGSYMPCFLAGYCSAKSICEATGVPLFETTHQVGHILSALGSDGKMSLTDGDFLVFHISGGTTQLLHCKCSERRIQTSVVAQSLDLKAGQGIDRIGRMLGLKFPAGPELDALARNSKRNFGKNPALKGGNCCLSGMENISQKMLADGYDKCDIAKFAIDYIGNAIEKMLAAAVEEFGQIPVVYTGGVMSNSILRRRFAQSGACFARDGFSSDNAYGVALWAKLNYNG